MTASALASAPAPISTVYISSGRQNGYYTLRVSRTGYGYTNDIYLRNLSTDSDKAEAKARDYFDRVYGGRSDAVFAGYADFDLSPWGRNLPVWALRALKDIDAGIWPFGKHRGTEIESSPDSYVFYWAKLETAETLPAQMLIEKCKSIAETRGLYAAAAAKEEARKAEAAKSQHVGTVKERRSFTVTIKAVLSFDGMYGTTYIHIMADEAGNQIIYKGTTVLGSKGETVTVKATVKEHGYRDGVAQTIIARPVK